MMMNERKIIKGGTLKKILFEVNREGNSFITYYRSENTSVLNYNIYNLNQLDAVQKKYLDEGAHITLVTVRS